MFLGESSRQRRGWISLKLLDVKIEDKINRTLWMTTEFSVSIETTINQAIHKSTSTPQFSIALFTLPLSRSLQRAPPRSLTHSRPSSLVTLIFPSAYPRKQGKHYANSFRLPPLAGNLGLFIVCSYMTEKWGVKIVRDSQWVNFILKVQLCNKINVLTFLWLVKWERVADNVSKQMENVSLSSIIEKYLCVTLQLHKSHQLTQIIETPFETSCMISNSFS